MYWHIDTDIVALIVISALYYYTVRMLPNDRFTAQNRGFVWCLRCGILMTAVDIAASVVMETPTPRFLYQALMIAYLLAQELVIVSWFLYSLTILYPDDRKRRKWVRRVVITPYAAYALLVLSNPWTALFFSLGPNMEYARGKLFVPAVVGLYFLYAIALLVLIFVRRKKIPPDYPKVVLIMQPVILGLAIPVQLLNPGWLVMFAAYMICLVLAFLFFQNVRVRNERALLGQLTELVEYFACGLAVIQIDAGHRMSVQYLSNEYCEIFEGERAALKRGLEEDPMFGVAPEDMPAVRASMEKLIQDYADQDMTYRYITPSGKQKWINVKVKVVRHSDGMAHCYSTYTDLTEQKEAQQLLKDNARELWAKYELARKRASMAEEGMIAYAVFNLTAKKTLEYAYSDGTEVPAEKRSAGPFCGGNAALLPDEKERAHFIALNDAKTLLERFARGESEFRFDYRRRMEDGETAWVRVSLHLVRDPRSGDALLFEYWYDIDEEKMQELMYRSIASDNYDYVARIDARTKHFVLFPKAGAGDAVPISGDDADAVTVSVFGEDIVVEDREPTSENMRIANIVENLKENGRFQFTFREAQQDGAFRYKKVTQYYIDQDRGIIAVLREDVTDVIREETEKNRILADALDAAKQASIAKSQFLSRVSHELRTPLNAIIGFMELAKDADGAQTALYLSNSDAAAKQLLSIINDVLDVSAIESGKLRIAHAPFDFKRLLQSVTNLYHQQCASKRLRFETRLLTPVDEWLIGDPLRVNQILLNLLNNAFKFTENGHVFLTVSQTNARDDRVFLRFTVEDTGCGMSEEMLSRMFRPFEQENAVVAQKYGGNGLGLSIVSSLVGMMDGVIRVESKRGEGSTFTVDLPFNTGETGISAGTIKDAQDLRVLSVDDEPSERGYISIIMERIGVRHTPVANGTAALAALSAAEAEGDPYNVCLVDWKMPDMNGIETTRRIREKYGQNVIVIVVSAYAHHQADESARAAGANLFIGKPLFQSSLFDLFSTLTGGRIAQREETPVQRRREGMRVLLAEDNAMNRMVAEGLIHRLGAECESAADGKIALKMFADSPAGYYDAILMDIQMPNMDGYEATRRIRCLPHPDAKTVQIIALTANAFNEDIAKSLSSGMNAHVAKPIEPEMLANALDKAFAARRGQG